MKAACSRKAQARVFRAVLLAILIPSVGLFADVLILKNGNKFEGKILEETPEQVVIEMTHGTMTFPRDQIKEIEKKGGYVVPKRPPGAEPAPKDMDKADEPKPTHSNSPKGEPNAGAMGPTVTLPKVDPGKMKLDGNASDWAGIKPIWEEAGATGNGMWGKTIDFKQVYLAHDGRNVLLLARSSPSPDDQYKDNERTGLFGLYFDADANRETGFEASGAFDIVAVKGSEFGVGMAARPKGRSYKDGCHIIMGLSAVNDKGKFAPDTQVGDRQDSDKEGSWVAHGPDGIELAIPIRHLDIKEGQPFRVLLGEANQNVDNAKALYSQVVVVIRDIPPPTPEEKTSEEMEREGLAFAAEVVALLNADKKAEFVAVCRPPQESYAKSYYEYYRPMTQEGATPHHLKKGKAGNYQVILRSVVQKGNMKSTAAIEAFTITKIDGHWRVLLGGGE